jgi:phosphatidylserine decarboxylase
MPVGMVEISSCKILPKIKPGYHLEKGEEIGYFQFGGSTSCLIFQKGVIKQFDKTWGFCRMGSLIATAY